MSQELPERGEVWQWTHENGQFQFVDLGRFEKVVIRGTRKLPDGKSIVIYHLADGRECETESFAFLLCYSKVANHFT